jgi:hypothetical protein
MTTPQRPEWLWVTKWTDDDAKDLSAEAITYIESREARIEELERALKRADQPRDPDGRFTWTREEAARCPLCELNPLHPWDIICSTCMDALVERFIPLLLREVAERVMTEEE